MAYTALKLITKSFYLSSIYSRKLETVEGDDISDGLDLLNALLAVQAIDFRLIPYYQQFTFPTVISQEKYFVENLLEVDTVTFDLNNVRYSMLPVQRKKYFGTGRVNNTESLMGEYHAERTKGGMDIYFYFLPNAVYPANVWGKFGLDSVELNDDLSEIYDPYYIEYLRYALAEFICAEWQVTFPQQAAQRLAQYQAKLMDVGGIDLSISKMSTLQSSTGLNWADINIGHGWRPG